MTDWICVDCGHENDGKEDACENCNTLRGAWKCTECKTLNGPDEKTCWKCDAEKFRWSS